MMGYIIAFDIGGTAIKSGIIDTRLLLRDETLATYPSESDRDADTIINNIDSIILDQWEKVRHENGSLQGIGFGFPGPFNYEQGISYIKGLGKYEAIYGLDIATPIKKYLNTTDIPLSDDFTIVFENDAAAFTLGEYEHLKAVGCDRLMGITLGTGCGSSFISQGKIVRGMFGVPESGEIFNQPFRESIIDDYISRRGILGLAAKHGMDTARVDVADVAVLAKNGAKEAQDVFDDFGKLLGEALIPYIKQFAPDIIVFGGQISKSFDLFGRGFQETLYHCAPRIKISQDLSRSALIGVANVVLRSR
ncbi:MAG TPA: ROK family protein [Bacillota bacterium]|nr:ROK family protein [Bacillota bacterium]